MHDSIDQSINQSINQSIKSTYSYVPQTAINIHTSIHDSMASLDSSVEEDDADKGPSRFGGQDNGLNRQWFK